ncbi:HAD hydrolase-like protein [Mesorhizobium sp. CO1-1-7]|uniref:HAD family hydrolase n=1 Tax=Mesorhizobium sp. CO1-1-7 TaxID=2876632 RepID=UPI001CD05FA7|nr:HAD family hydrolase [Mesorhizobium sp. CO1-1-7]MBZ9744307.1 HAD hydrolase-like protein [Mesorhizobium sp. CO1-1-7]
MSAISAIFFDVRDTLGTVDSPGHLVPFRPTTQMLLEAVQSLGVRMGAITNLPSDISDAAGRDMVTQAVLSQRTDGGHLTIGDFIARVDIITNHEAAADKPAAAIYEFAANKFKVPIAQCLFIGENFNECIGAKLAGMDSLTKPNPPGGEFMRALVGKLDASANSSGRQFEAMLEHEHMLGERIFAVGGAIALGIGVLVNGKAPVQVPDRWTSPPNIAVPAELRRAMALFLHLIDHFADPVHLKAEEAMIEFAVGCGLPRRSGQWVFDQHDQARAYWRGIDVAWRRIQTGDDDDRFYALQDFKALADAFVVLFKAHAVRENNQLYPDAGAVFNDADDALVLNMIQHSGVPDISPYIGIVERAEALLGIKPE